MHICVRVCVCILRQAVCVCMHAFFVLLLRMGNNSVTLSQLNRNRPTNTPIKVTDKQMCSGMHTGMCVCVRWDIFLQDCETECLQEKICKYESASKETVSW